MARDPSDLDDATLHSPLAEAEKRSRARRARRAAARRTGSGSRGETGSPGALEGWRAFSRRMAEVHSIEALAEAAMGFVRAQVPVEYAAFYVQDLVDGSLRLLQADGFTPKEREAAERSAWGRHPGMVVRTGRLLLVPDVERDEQRLSRSSPRSFEVRSRLFFPMTTSKGGVGTVGLASSKPHAFGERHATVLAIVAELASSVYERLATEEALRRRDAMLSALSRGTRGLMRAEDWDLALAELLGDLGRTLDLSRVNVASIQPRRQGPARLVAEYTWRAQGIRPRIFSTSKGRAPAGVSTHVDLLERLERDEVPGGPTTSHHPTLRPFLEQQGIKSILMAPVRVNDKLWGLVGLEDCRRARVWSPPEADALRAVAGTLGAALQRREDERRLQESEARHRAAVHDQAELLCRSDPEGQLEFANPAFLRFFGLESKEWRGHKVRIPARPAARTEGAGGFVMLELNDRVEISEERHRAAGGQVRWLQWSDRPLRDAQGELVGYQSVGRDITEAHKARAEKDRLVRELRKAVEGTASALSQLVEQRDPYTAGHQRRVAALAAAIAESMGLASEEVAGITIGALVHDLGKISVPVEILSKPSQLSSIERRLIQEHPETGYQILAPLDFPWPVAEMVRQHHERMDGSGYPRGLKGDQILLEARIIAVADAVEAASSDRPYRPARGLSHALEYVESHRAVHYDPEVVSACAMLFRHKGFTFPED
jgi:PAS domain S-box-containing protein/putative nucleotidyltransferase with HDIG domain